MEPLKKRLETYLEKLKQRQEAYKTEHCYCEADHDIKAGRQSELSDVIHGIEHILTEI